MSLVFLDLNSLIVFSNFLFLSFSSFNSFFNLLISLSFKISFLFSFLIIGFLFSFVILAYCGIKSSKVFDLCYKNNNNKKIQTINIYKIIIYTILKYKNNKIITEHLINII